MTTTTHCPQCQSPLMSVALAANTPAILATQRQGLALPTPSSPQQSGGLGGVTLLLCFSLAMATSVIIGGVAELTIGTNIPAQGLKVGDTAIYTGIATFIVEMTALFSVFVWRQARNDTVLKNKLIYVAQTKTTICARILLPAVSIPRVTAFAVRQ